MGSAPKAKSLKIPPEIKVAQLTLRRAHKNHKLALKTNIEKLSLKCKENLQIYGQKTESQGRS